MPVAVKSLLLSAVLLSFSAPVWAKKIDLDYKVRFLPESDQAEVRIILERGEAVSSFDFDLGEEGHYSDFEADGQWERKGDDRGIWKPADGKASLRYRVRISHMRKNGRFDARMTEDWALFRGDDLIPSARLKQQKGTQLVSRIEFELPEGWEGVETGWPRIGPQRFRIDNPERKFDRPIGWMVAGKIGSRRDLLGNTAITVSAPLGEGMRRLDVLTFLTFTWAELQAVFPREPDKLLIVGANDPMWRGGLSAPNSLFMHADRPVVSENGTSSLLHELVHVVGRIYGKDRSDWISEGLAEYYAVEILRRAGGLSDDRYKKLRAHLTAWGSKVKSLRGERVKGPVTARAVLLLQDLDQEIRKRTKNQRSLDDVTRGLMRLDKVSTREFIDVSENVMGGPSKVLDTKLLR